MSPEQEAKLNDIHRALVGDDDMGIEGLVKKVERHDRWINNAKVRIAGIMGGCVVILWALEHLFGK